MFVQSYMAFIEQVNYTNANKLQVMSTQKFIALLLPLLRKMVWGLSLNIQLAIDSIFEQEMH